MSTAAPAPGRFVEAYEAAAAAGATQIVSIHIGSNTSATIDAARIAAGTATVPVEIVDTETASFPVACCVWMAARVLTAGGDVAEVVRAARDAAAAVDNVFVVGALDLARRGGRLEPGAELGGGVPVLAMHGGTMNLVAQAADVDAAVDAMVAYVRERAGTTPQLVGIGHAGRDRDRRLARRRAHRGSARRRRPGRRRARPLQHQPLRRRAHRRRNRRLRLPAGHGGPLIASRRMMAIIS